MEMVFLLYRCVLPVPPWLEFYNSDSEYFPALYLVLKVKWGIVSSLLAPSNSSHETGD